MREVIWGGEGRILVKLQPYTCQIKPSLIRVNILPNLACDVPKFNFRNLACQSHSIFYFRANMGTFSDIRYMRSQVSKWENVHNVFSFLFSTTTNFNRFLWSMVENLMYQHEYKHPNKSCSTLRLCRSTLNSHPW